MFYFFFFFLELILYKSGHFNDEKEKEKDVEAQELLAADDNEKELEEVSAPESTVVVNIAAVDLQAMSIEEQQHSKNPE